MRRNHRWLRLPAWLTVMAVVVTACSSSAVTAAPSMAVTPAATSAATSTAAPGVTQEVVFWQFSDRQVEIDAYQALITKFEAAHPNIKINMQIVPWADQAQKLTTALTSGGLPDVSMLGNNVVAQFQHIGALAPLDDYVTAESTRVGKDITADFWPGDKLYYYLDNHWWGMPVAEDTLGLFYRKDLFAAAGLQPPKTWDEFKTDAQLLTKNGVYGAGWLQSIDYVTLQAFMSVYLSYGARFLNDQGKCGFDTPEFKQALDYYTSIFKSGWTPPDSATYAFPDMEAQWKAGKLAMFLDSAYLWADTQTANPDVAKNMAVAPVPSGPKGQFAFLGGWPLVLWNASKVKDAAAQWIMFATNAENVLQLDRAAGQLPGRVSNAQMDPWNKDPYTVFLGQMPRAFPYQYPDAEIPQMGGLEPAAVQTAVQAVALGQASLDSATATLCKTINDALSK
jgi:multiple sugar transport system substrate-binding protein